ncbi:tripartite tricarboxylate transporter family receptor [Variibacter gotjawalensis]|uniref:Tripartite tricarboxylate transporter family receptor n=1 Tax=Variibacter gotjawalensis TaxID=1333996 RepID=A0A0S3PY95_9BRAD|nr:tripartite tricarboxylate transporter substrate binding protein [Variibacter gotjawalensis]NIK46741.1 tripartite-type tricarboxylate transporter receptor subunit TctC [Variibacter gotjawalensis]RZS48645.1 tripartite-type tricarboxylate transporter receptor subunit TctC [Variibacter gotjawalensis]BAT60905.1 tripartite tricarboxylate transporter family receptor [Variibacter gotjawalensis]
MLKTIIAAAAAVLSVAPVAAQEYPNKRITFIVPYAPGGATDVSARILAQALQDAWKQPVIVENKPGGGGITGNDFVAKAAPDGYTVLVGITHVIQAPALGMKLPYDAFKNLAPITAVGISTIVFSVPMASPSKTMQEFVAHAKAGKYSYGSFGNATTSHLYGELLKKQTGIDMTHVPYRGSALATNDVIGGQVQGAFLDYTTVGAHVHGGKVRALAVGGEKRNPFLPDVPSMGELGFQGYEAEGWVGVFVPGGTPAPIVKKLSDELARIIQSKDGSERIKNTGLVPVGNTAEDYAVMLKKDYDRWKTTAEIAGVKAE